MNAKFKMFCIGLPKTGTTSLNEALKILGYKSFHAELCVLKNILIGCFDFDFEWDALTHSVERAYPYLDCKYPDSKFILTVRDFTSWRESVEKQLDRKNFEKSKWNIYRRIYSFGLYKCKNGKVLHSIHAMHESAVNRYFSGRSGLLVMNIVNGDGWNQLCGFLDKKTPDAPFPWMNKK